jgi:hypothetical protein
MAEKSSRRRYTLKANDNGDVEIVQCDSSRGPHVFIDDVGDTMALDPSKTLSALRVAAELQAAWKRGTIPPEAEPFVRTSLSLARALHAIAADEAQPGAGFDDMVAELGLITWAPTTATA